MFGGAQPPIMKNKKMLRFVESVILLPTFAISGASMGPVSQAVVGIVNNQSVFVSSENQDMEAADREKENVRAIKAERINAYFRQRGMPLEGTGMKMVLEAEKNNIDWRLLPAIAVRESTGGKFACKKATYSSFGWGSCKINFQSHEEEIEVVARNLGGNNPKTLRYYGGKDVKGILQAYNPPSVVPRYAEQVISIMDAIGQAEPDLESHPLAMIN
jgi:hypothetical protein